MVRPLLWVAGVLGSNKAKAANAIAEKILVWMECNNLSPRARCPSILTRFDAIS
jgi:hypothetical protein